MPRSPASPKTQAVRQRWSIAGQVQGVGFRPFVYRLAQSCGLSGFICNDSAGVLIEVQGAQTQLDLFAARIQDERPPLAVYQSISCRSIPTRADEMGFQIDESQTDSTPGATVTVDTAVCGQCVAEMLDPHDRRHRHPLITCTNCGPRYSIIRRVPYDRPNTTMAGFAMCPDCAAEYERPSDRRFHAQPIACPRCGPRLQLLKPDGNPIEGDPIEQAVQRLLVGQILAIKGVGGFHLAVRADDSAAVQRLRAIKHRDEKPFALMCASVADAKRLVELSAAAEEAMMSLAAPILLAPRVDGAPVAREVAPDSTRLGIMLPYTPIHHLLYSSLITHHSALPLVMTSGNQADEPIVIDDADAIQRLGPLCDAILLHDRPIERRLDDSILLDMGKEEPLPIRRARGYVPTELKLPSAGSSMGLCVGGELKSTLAVVRGDRVILSQHLGDLTHPLAYEHFQKTAEDLCQLFGIDVQWIAHDLHPLYLSTQLAKQLADKLHVPLVGIQHHHAHAAAVLAEHERTRPTLALVCDGVGYGPDGTSWGGELMVAELKRFCRLAHLRPLVLPGGDAAAHDTRRSGLALLYQAFGDRFEEHPAARRLVPEDEERKLLCQMMRGKLHCAISSSAGRVFDGVAALLGVCLHNEYEAQAPMRLEALAAGVRKRMEREEPFVLEGGQMTQIDLSPLTRSLVTKLDQGVPVEELAWHFHAQFARALARTVSAAAETTGLWCVALSGGVFCNQLLTHMLSHRLEKRGIRVLRHRLVPPNDGGLAFGQAAIAAAMKQARDGQRPG